MQVFRFFAGGDARGVGLGVRFVQGSGRDRLQARPSVQKSSCGTSDAGRSATMKRRLCLVCGALAGITILHCTALAEAATAAVPASAAAGSASPKTNGQDLRNQGSRSIEEQCEDEWKA